MLILIYLLGNLDFQVIWLLIQNLVLLYQLRHSRLALSAVIWKIGQNLCRETCNIGKTFAWQLIWTEFRLSITGRIWISKLSFPFFACIVMCISRLERRRNTSYGVHQIIGFMLKGFVLLKRTLHKIRKYILELHILSGDRLDLMVGLFNFLLELTELFILYFNLVIFVKYFSRELNNCLSGFLVISCEYLKHF